MFQNQSLVHFRDLTAKTKHSQLHDIVGRDTLLRRLERIIARRQKRHAILIGEKGVGKTALVQAFAFRLSRHRIKSIQQMKVFHLDIHQILLGLMSSDSETFVKEITQAFHYLRNTIVFIDDLGLLLEAGNDYLTAFVYLMQPFLERSDLHILTEVQPSHWRQLLEKDIVFSRHFEAIIVQEPSTDQAKAMVTVAAGKMRQQYRNLSLDESIITQSVTLAKRYLHDRALPDKAIDLLDEALAQCVIEGKMTVTTNDLKKIISERTGIPIENLTSSEQIKLARLEENLKRAVVGQDHAIQAVAAVIKRSRTGFRDPARPIGSFLFMGPSGVGKTELTKTLAKTVYDSEKALIRLDMSEFSEAHNAQRLIGAPPGYVGYEQGGQLTNPVAAQPYSLIVLDEIEKAHPKVFDIFLQVLDEGRLTDGQGKTVDFRNTIIIATSNIALEGIHDVTTPDFVGQTLMPILMTYFRPEFINRFDAITVFKPLDRHAMQQIVRLEIDKMIDRVKNQNINVTIAESTIAKIVDRGYNPTFGARPLKRFIQENFENLIAQQVVEGQLKAGQLIEF